MPDNHGHLNVIFHGLFAFVIHDQCIEVLVPTILQHTPQAGTWTRELPLHHLCSYHLTGVERLDRPACFPHYEMPVLQSFSVVDRSPHRLFCSIYLPYPREITLFRSSDQPLPFMGDTSRQIVAKTIPLIPVLTYDFNYYEKVEIDGLKGWHPDAPSWNPDSLNRNLHVFSEPTPKAAANLHPTHEITSFAKLTRLFPGMDLKLSFSPSAFRMKETSSTETASPEDTAKSKKADGLGIDESEFKSLIERKEEKYNGDPDPVYCISIVVDNTRNP